LFEIARNHSGESNSQSVGKIDAGE